MRLRIQGAGLPSNGAIVIADDWNTAREALSSLPAAKDARIELFDPSNGSFRELETPADWTGEFESLGLRSGQTLRVSSKLGAEEASAPAEELPPLMQQGEEADLMLAIALSMGESGDHIDAALAARSSAGSSAVGGGGGSSSARQEAAAAVGSFARFLRDTAAPPEELERVWRQHAKDLGLSVRAPGPMADVPWVVGCWNAHLSQ